MNKDDNPNQSAGAPSLLTPLEAAQKGMCCDYFTKYPLREWALVKKIRGAIATDLCGELCSLRFTWQRSKKDSSDQSTFLYETLAGLIDAAWFIADAPLTSLHVEKVPNRNNLFALAQFKNLVSAEIEANECLPDSMPATNFIKANFTHGHITNQPVVGHFNEEGAILADDTGFQRLVIENSDWDDCGDEIALCGRLMYRAIEQGDYPPGPLNSVAIINAISAAVEDDR